MSCNNINQQRTPFLSLMATTETKFGMSNQQQLLLLLMKLCLSPFVNDLQLLLLLLMLMLLLLQQLLLLLFIMASFD